MPTATFRFYEELNDFLPAGRRKRDFEIAFKGRESVKDMIEALGVPHTEVDLILINGISVDFAYILQDGDRISVYPVFESLDIRAATHLRDLPLRETRFIADTNIGNIVKYMRALGLDVHCDLTLCPREITRISNQEKRTILTRSRKLLKRRDVTRGIFIRPGTTVQQIRQIIHLLSLKEAIAPFSRCLVCNTPLVKTTKESVYDRIPPKVRAFCNDYAYCSGCDRIYWQGTHFARIKQVVDRILAP
ncbi:MAG: hypothetical protein B5M55_06140 [Desulfococcus sp. 4484_242]|nr:MAG: hypothetical protein B5M55_06140 [Desulfococcus sp. 4484_242]